MNRAISVETPTGPGEMPARWVETYLSDWLDARPMPENLREAVRYAVLGPGKRLRPTLTVRCCQAVGGSAAEAMPPAAAVEMIHAFSLVHDDLPALDNDDLRRGRPTLHRHAGEAMAILAGDALLGLAVELLVERLPAERVEPVCGELIRGCNAMIVGQVYDTLPASDRTGSALDRLKTTHRNKTGALIRAACRAGGLSGGADPAQLEAVTGFGEAVGLMFQVVDDLLDVTETTEHLGKTAGKDVEQGKLTYPALMGLEASREEVRRLADEAHAALEPLGEWAGALGELCDYLASRTR
jgi:geranylgeranyl diphosphate synthase type II